MTQALQLGFLLAVPLLAWAGNRAMVPLRALGPVVLAYLLGIALANLPGIQVDAALSQRLAEIAVPLSIPLLLFPTDVRNWFLTARSALVSFFAACAASMVAALLFGTYLAGHLADSPRISGMLAGAYIGGTMNLNAVGLALGANKETFVLLNAADVVAGGAWLLLLLTVAHRLVAKLLPAWTGTLAASEDGAVAAPPRKIAVRDGAAALGLAVLVVAASAGLSFLVFGELAPVAVLLCITSLSLGLSFIRKVRTLHGSALLGDYAMLVFCASIGSLVSARALMQADPTLLFVCGGVTLTAVAVHLALARLLKIDAHTMLITSTAAVFGPAFVPAVARALGNQAVVPSGVTLGLAGFAVGTYLGLFTAWVLGG